MFVCTVWHQLYTSVHTVHIINDHLLTTWKATLRTTCLFVNGEGVLNCCLSPQSIAVCMEWQLIEVVAKEQGILRNKQQKSVPVVIKGIGAF